MFIAGNDGSSTGISDHSCDGGIGNGDIQWHSNHPTVDDSHHGFSHFGAVLHKNDDAVALSQSAVEERVGDS